MLHAHKLASLVIALFIAAGCAKSPPPERTGFLSDYSKLTKVNDHRMNYVSDELARYDSYIIDPIEFRMPPQKLDAGQRAEVARHFRSRLKSALENRGLKVTDDPGPNTARVRIAMTDIANSTWWMKVHPASRIAGAGTGGASMEGEVVDSVTGSQVGAVVQAATGNQLNFTAFTTVQDVNAAIDKWAEQAGQRLEELRGKRASGS
jgi:hypothetical protein